MIKRLRLILKLMKSQTIITIHILPNISRNNEAGRLVPDFILFFLKVLCKVKTSGQYLRFNLFE